MRRLVGESDFSYSFRQQALIKHQQMLDGLAIQKEIMRTGVRNHEYMDDECWTEIWTLVDEMQKDFDKEQKELEQHRQRGYYANRLLLR